MLCLCLCLCPCYQVLLLDEATSSVDLETDEVIQRAIRNSFTGCTILTIAHRVETIIDRCLFASYVPFVFV